VGILASETPVEAIEQGEELQWVATSRRLRYSGCEGKNSVVKNEQSSPAIWSPARGAVERDHGCGPLPQNLVYSGSTVSVIVMPGLLLFLSYSSPPWPDRYPIALQ